MVATVKFAKVSELKKDLTFLVRVLEVCILFIDYTHTYNTEVQHFV